MIYVIFACLIGSGSILLFRHMFVSGMEQEARRRQMNKDYWLNSSCFGASKEWNEV